ncbi:MAG: hypothetical protein WD273_12155 [Trueperaceae bacterium]
MSQHRDYLEAAKAAWNALPPGNRRELEEFLSDEQGGSGEAELVDVVLVRLLAQDPFIRDRYGKTTAGAKDRLTRMVARVTGVLFESRVRAEDMHALAHEAGAPLARERALSQLADELMLVAGPDMRAKAREILAAPAPGVVAEPWLFKPDRLLLSVDHVSLSCARYLAGLQAAERDSYGFDELHAGPAGRAKRIDRVTVKFDPQGSREPGRRGTDTEPHTGPEASELKAKLFVALFAMAAQAKARSESGSLRVRLRDLLEMLGFELGRVTNSSYYWRYAAQLARYLLIDLPNRVVAMQVSYTGGRELVVFERLLTLVWPLDAERQPLEQGEVEYLREALGRAVPAPTEAIRESGLAGFEFAVSDDLLEAHGIGKPMNAVEHVPVEVLSLKGPAFWLAWQVAFLRRWARPPESGAQGKPLLRVLEEAGYIGAYSRGKRVRYKDAVRAWWRDTGELVNMGLLDEPGVRLYGQRGSSWRDVSSEISRFLDPLGERLMRHRLQDVRVVFQIPRWRVAQLEEARRRKRKRPAHIGTS